MEVVPVAPDSKPWRLVQGHRDGMRVRQRTELSTKHCPKASAPTLLPAALPWDFRRATGLTVPFLWGSLCPEL